jgi:hypothetical protein
MIIYNEEDRVVIACNSILRRRGDPLVSGHRRCKPGKLSQANSQVKGLSGRLGKSVGETPPIAPTGQHC